MAKLAAVQHQRRPPSSLSLLPSSFSDFNGTRLHACIQVLTFLSLSLTVVQSRILEKLAFFYWVFAQINFDLGFRLFSLMNF